MEQFSSFLNLVMEFRGRGFEVETQYVATDGKEYMIGDVNCNKICAKFASEDGCFMIGGGCKGIAVDRRDCFDKWSKCPISLPLPQTHEQVEFLFEKIKWLLTYEGKCVSNKMLHERYVTSYGGI